MVDGSPSAQKYGLNALIHLAVLEPGEQVLSADIAAATNVSKKILDGILRELRQSGLVRAKKGPSGGYALARPSRMIRVGNAIRQLDGPSLRFPVPVGTPVTHAATVEILRRVRSVLQQRASATQRQKYLTK